MMTIEVFSARGCEKCVGGQDRLQQIATSVLGEDAFIWREVDVLQELDYAVALGVLSMPAIAIDGRLVCPTLPTETQWRKLLQSMKAA